MMQRKKFKTGSWRDSSRPFKPDVIASNRALVATLPVEAREQLVEIVFRITEHHQHGGVSAEIIGLDGAHPRI